MADFRINVIVDPAAAERGNKRVRDELQRTELAASKLQRTIRQAFAIGAGGVAIRQLVRGYVELSDTFTQAQNRLRFVTSGIEDLTAAQRALFDISTRTRSNFESTTELFVRASLATRELGRSQQDVLRFTESLNKAIILSGASAVEAKNGLIQLSQGLAAGRLQGRDLRSVLEQLPAVADVIAQRLGVTRGALRELGQEGRLTADVIVDSLIGAADQLDQQFADTVPTISQSFEVLRTRLVEFVGKENEAIGASKLLSDGIIALADNVEDLAEILVSAVSGYVAYRGAALLADSATGGVVKGVTALNRVLLLNPYTTIALAVAGAVLELQNLNREFDSFLTRAEKASGLAFGGFESIGTTEDDLRQQEAQLVKILQAGGGTSQTFVQLTRVRQRLMELQEENKKAAASTDEHAQALEMLQKAFDGANQSLENQRLSLMKLIEGRTAEAELVETVARIEQSTGQKVSDAQQVALLAGIKRKQALEDQLAALQAIRGPQEDFIRLLEGAAALERTGAINADEFRSALLQFFEQAGAAAQNFDLSQLPEDLRAAAEQARALAAEAGRMEEFARATQTLNDAAAQRGFDAGRAAREQSDAEQADTVIARLREIGDQAMTTSELITSSLSSGFSGAEDALVEFARTGKVSFNDLANSILDDLARIIARQLVLQAIGGIVGAPVAAARGAVIPYGGRRQGGGGVGPHQAFLVGEQGPELFRPPGAGRIVPAPETAGLLESMMSRFNQGPIVVPPPAITITNVMDPAEVPRGIESSAGEQAVLNVISRKRGTVRGIIG